VIVAIDGPAGVGKSTISRKAASATGMYYLNSGNFYRAITLAVLKAGINPEIDESVLEIAENADIQLIDGKITLNGRKVENELHADNVDSWVAQHSAIVKVRHIVNRILRKVVGDINAIVEGRDISTVVFPNAAVKIYLDASVDVRAQRRFEQGVSKKTLKELRSNIEMRDKIDKNKELGSLIIPDDAFYLDTSHLTIDQVCEKVVRKIQDIER
jgi:cytidylate kinase